MPDVVADSSPLQYLHTIALLDLLRQTYGAIVVPVAVSDELEAGRSLGVDLPDLKALPWIHVESVTGGSYQPMDNTLGKGEREAISLALGKPDPLLIFDDRNARHEAQRLSLPFTGVLGVLLRAKRDGRIRDLAPRLDDLRQSGFYLDAATRRHVLHLAGEIP